MAQRYKPSLLLFFLHAGIIDLMKLLSVIILMWFGVLSFAAEPYRFIPVDNIPQPCAGHASVVDDQNRVIVLGGYSYFLEVFPVASNLIRIFDPKENKWSCSRVRIKIPRMYAAAVALSNNRILIVGGIG
ncbi:MAG: kelch motif-containing protein, partial [Spirochaetes bacterium]|nr:kelch motif-containing protein [Spirochaetota bacterium]